MWAEISILGSWYLNRDCSLIAQELDLVRMVSCRSDSPLGLVKRVRPGGCCGHCDVCLIFPLRTKALTLCAARSVGSCQLSADPSPVKITLKEATLSIAVPLSWGRQQTVIGLLWGYKSLTLLPQGWTALNGLPCFRVPHLCCGFITVQALPLSGPASLQLLVWGFP